MSLCLNSIVKNESGRIVRMLESVAPFIDYWVILDTGSTDDTIQKIEAFFKVVKIPGKIVRGEFKDFGQARNDALRAARSCARAGKFDYILLVDADMELKVNDRRCFEGLSAPSYDMHQTAGTMHYLNRRLVRSNIKAEYLGVTHEFLNADGGGAIPKDKAFFVDHADGSNRKSKFIRDIRLLKSGLAQEPDNARYMFYLAQSYRDAGKPKEAIKWYEKRIKAGGWAEEVWYSQFMIASCWQDLKNEAEYINNLLKAYQLRPSRKESLYTLARYYRDRSQNALAMVFAERAAELPPSGDSLFTDNYMETVGPLEELSISGFYVADKRAKGLEATSKLSLMRTAYSGTVELARKNMYYYLQPLKEICPSFESETLDFTAPTRWAPMNPSVTNHKGRLHCVVRTVNYYMDNDGRYWIGDKWPSDEHPITTRNFLLSMCDDLKVYDKKEIHPHGNEPAPLYKAVLGFEDMRLFSWKGDLWTSSTMREKCADGLPEQVLACLLPWEGMIIASDVQRILREPRECQKNWMPMVVAKKLQFMYRLGEIVDAKGKTIWHKDTLLSTGHISGGSQLIPFGSGWLSLVHEARYLPDQPYKRYYWHRFAFFTAEGALDHLSNPFVFEDKQIEFAAGLCAHPDGKRLVISYGVRDAEARIATVDIGEVRAL